MKEKQVYLISAIVLIIASMFSLGFHHFDEHHQILEFAGLKLGMTVAENLPWEYHNQMRPSLQPAMVVVVVKFFNMIGITSPFYITWFLRLISAGLAFLSIHLLYKTFLPQIKNEVARKWFLVFNFLLFFLIYIGVRFSSENWSAIFFILPFCLFFLQKEKRFLHYLSIGVLLGLSFLFRYQGAFLVAGFLGWMLFIQREKMKHFFTAFLGVCIIIGLGTLVDCWYYEEWTIAPWNYFEQNLLMDKVSSFGVDPWWYYLEVFSLQAVPPFSIVLIITLLLVIVFDWKSPITWSVVPFLAIHFLIGHKELRFLFPVAYFLPIILIKGFEIIQQKYWNNFFETKALKIFMKVFLVINTLMLLVIMFRAADSQVALYQVIYERYKEPVTVYTVKKNPYRRVLDVYFYKRSNVTIKEVESLSEIPTNHKQKTVLVLHYRDKESKKHKQNAPLIYESFPEWIKNYNFNNWLDRTNGWIVYEIH